MGMACIMHVLAMLMHYWVGLNFMLEVLGRHAVVPDVLAMIAFPYYIAVGLKAGWA